MKLRLKLIIILYAIPLLLSGKAHISDLPVNLEIQKTGTSDSIQVIQQRTEPKTKSFQPAAKEDSIYSIGTNEERIYDNFLTRHFFFRIQ